MHASNIGEQTAIPKCLDLLVGCQQFILLKSTILTAYVALGVKRPMIVHAPIKTRQRLP
jgi:hypothetical protein